ncbi:MAG TPA: GNAT family N-acetyltransferase [Acidimicrobiales bacterium]|nr:GNAT family N-acetyltransferase [Acidimicrobiales bacterium]
MPTLREARAEDALEIAGVHVRSWQVAYRGLLDDDYLDALRPEDRVDRYSLGGTSNASPRTIVAVENGRIRGFATTGASRDADRAGAGELYALYVDPPSWSTGIGRLLMVRARSHLVRDGFDQAVLWLLGGNARAERFYLTDGWSIEGSKREEDVWGIRVEVVRFARRLP